MHGQKNIKIYKFTFNGRVKLLVKAVLSYF